MKSIDYGAIAVLRTLLLKIYRPEHWQKFLLLEHHNDDRRNLSLWNDDKMIAKIIREQWNLGELFSEDEIHIVSATPPLLTRSLLTIVVNSSTFFYFLLDMWNL